MQDLISIIVPIYNVEKYLDRCIASIVNQTYKNLQIILVNDGSTDKSPEICEYYRKRDSRIQMIHKENGGLVSARKAGIEVAQGVYAGYVDGDDWIEPDMYEHMLNCMKQSGADLIETDHYIESEGSLQKVKSKIGYGLLASKEIIPIMLSDDNFDECRLKPYIWSKLFKKECLQKMQMSVDEQIGCGEDGAVVYPYILNCEKIFVSEYAGYHYIQRPGSMTNARCEKELRREIALFRYLKNAFENTDYASVMLEQLNQYAKSVILLRQISYFDKENTLLIPFGGVSAGERLVLYGAGKLGQSIWRYIQEMEKIDLLDWFDKNYILYRDMGFPVNNPEGLKAVQEDCDKIIIAVSSKRLAQSIEKDLWNMGIKKEKLIWLTEIFTDKKENILDCFVK